MGGSSKIVFLFKFLSVLHHNSTMFLVKKLKLGTRNPDRVLLQSLEILV